MATVLFSNEWLVYVFSFPILLRLLFAVVLLRWLFETLYPRHLLRGFKRRKDALPVFEDVWKEAKYLSTLTGKQRRQYYRDKSGYACYLDTHYHHKAGLTDGET